MSIQQVGVQVCFLLLFKPYCYIDDDGRTVDGPAMLTKQAFEVGIRQGLLFIEFKYISI
jgi:hypothetical protein